jgi:hypothetical protein
MAENRHCLVLLFLVATVWTIPYSLHAQEAKVGPPNLSSILDSLERIGEQNPALSRPYEVTRQYKVFHADEPKLCLANCYAGRFHPLSPCECELSLAFGTQDHTW